MDEPKPTLVDWQGRQIGHTYTSHVGPPAMWSSVGTTTRAWPLAEPITLSGTVQGPPRRRRRKRVLMSQGEVRPGLITGPHWVMR